MALEMIDGDQRLAGGERQPLAGEQGDHHSADQPRSGGRRDRVDVADGQLRFVEHPPDQVGQDLDVRARGDLRHHPAVGLVGAVLADDRLREDLPVAGDQRRRAVVAGRFKAQDRQSFRARPFA